MKLISVPSLKRLSNKFTLLMACASIITLGLTFAYYQTTINQADQALASSDNSKQLIVELVNKHRNQLNLHSLKIDTRLSNSAQRKAQEMADLSYFSHTSPNKKTPWQFINEDGYKYSTAAENIAFGYANSDEVVKGWLNSKGHRQNIENKNYVDIGIGIAYGSVQPNRAKGLIFVQHFGRE
jgi:uncharacterized protein YkwD